MDIDKQISSLEGNNIFSNDSSSSLKITAIKISCILLISMLVTYIINPFVIIDIEYDETNQKCSHNIIIKRFFIELKQILLDLTLILIKIHLKIFCLVLHRQNQQHRHSRI